MNSSKKDPHEKKSKRIYNLKENFINSNLYTCIELNAHALVKKILVDDSCEDNICCDRNEIFFPNLLASQPCESTFRQVRSFTSTFSTVVNFTMLDIMHRIKKIQLQNEIFRTSNGKITFPRIEKKAAMAEVSKEQYQFESLTEAVIIVEIEKARNTVLSDLENLGIDSSKLNFHCQVQPVFEMDDSSGDIDSDEDSDTDEELNMYSERTDNEGNVENDLGCGIEDEDIQQDLDTLSGTVTITKWSFNDSFLFFHLLRNNR